MSGLAFISADKNDLVCQQILSVVKNWLPEEGECKPSGVCFAVAELGAVTYGDCAEQLSVLLQQGNLKLEPLDRGLYIP